eukprot:5134365-Alexandrium_andersonii.AAC.1
MARTQRGHRHAAWPAQPMHGTGVLQARWPPGIVTGHTNSTCVSRHDTGAGLAWAGTGTIQ